MVTEDKESVPADGWVISSESCGFLSIGARYVREVSIFYMVGFLTSYNRRINGYLRYNREKSSKSQRKAYVPLTLWNASRIENQRFVYLNMYTLHGPIRSSKDRWCILYVSSVACS